MSYFCGVHHAWHQIYFESSWTTITWYRRIEQDRRKGGTADVNGTITSRNLEIYHPSFAVDVLMTWHSKRGTCWCNMLRKPSSQKMVYWCMCVSQRIIFNRALLGVWHRIGVTGHFDCQSLERCRYFSRVCLNSWEIGARAGLRYVGRE